MDITTNHPKLGKLNNRAMDKLIPIHHSLVDWDFQSPHNYYIGVLFKVSPPTALACPNVHNVPVDRYVYLKEAISGILTDGRFTTYTLSRPGIGSALYWWCFFRQPMPLTQYGTGGYALSFQYNQYRLYKAAVLIQTQGIVPNLAYDIWYRWRISFWTYIDSLLNQLLRVTVELDRGTGFEELGFWDDTSPINQSPPNNRIGFSLYGRYQQTGQGTCWIDDTEVFARFPG